ncbi:hypothetical protein [Legionella cincinnatiensis]|uniref:Periplasmic ligand-binding sensor domain protein n=1 Tax=Legionella cincinnatiensis TaxID=28085 RepID=A0A378IHP5_9GAMM|nr:hypothetical protein [Legionella cincinnatiensis]KTC91771.1 periplasmic ligand-binding sensor domain protein [Legionella cincinnatiensis]STX34526.1 periplasmic ligand-binding sensor domain protein [Legionella cincinnatiensis]
MQAKTENNSGNQGLSFSLTPYVLANLGVKTAAISFSVSTLTQPFQAMLTRLQVNAPSGFNGGLFRSMYRGFVPYAIAGQKRGAVSVTAKQANKEVIEEEEMEIPGRQRWMGTFLFSQADLLISNALGGKSKLENAGIITKANFKWSFANYWKLTGVNWGSRSFAGFVNFSALGFVGDYISSFYKFNNDFYNKLAGGSTAGVIATIFTTIPNSYADRKVLASKVENGRLLTVSPFTMFGQVKSHVKSVGMKEAFSHFVKFNFLKEVLVRSPMSALTFGIIFGLDDLMGPEPLKKVWPKVEEIDTEQSKSNPSKRM